MNEPSTASKEAGPGLYQILCTRWKLGLVLFAGISGLAYLCNMITTDQEYLGRAVIEVKRNLQAGPLNEKPAAPATLSPGFMRTQVMVLSCEENMLR